MGALNTVVAVCIACHGASGEGNSSGVPRLAGQNAGYLAHQLATFKEGTRASAIMQPVARDLDEAGIAAVAAYFSKQVAPLADAPAPVLPGLALAGGMLSESGTSEVPPCFSCHAAYGKGNGARFPAIAGQPSRYLVDRLHEFQARARREAPKPGSMTEVASALDESQVEQVAAYLSRLDPR